MKSVIFFFYISYLGNIIFLLIHANLRLCIVKNQYLFVLTVQDACVNLWDILESITFRHFQVRSMFLVTDRTTIRKRLAFAAAIA